MADALEIHAYYSKLFEGFAMLPTDDISSALFERACYLWAEEPWNEFGKFLERIEAYADTNQLSRPKKEAVAKFLARQKPYFERCCWLIEERPRLIQADVPDLKRRFDAVMNGFLWADFEAVDKNDTTALATHREQIMGVIERRLALLKERAEHARAVADEEPSISALSDYRRIALFLHYENKLPPTTDAILQQQYNKPSLKQLKKYYNSLHGSSSRDGAQGKELAPMIAAIEAVIPVLSEKARQVANEELRKLTRNK